MDSPLRHLSHEERRYYEDRILKMRDEDGLKFKIIAQRLGISLSRISKYYKNAKGRINCQEK